MGQQRPKRYVRFVGDANVNAPKAMNAKEACGVVEREFKKSCRDFLAPAVGVDLDVEE